MWWHTHILCNHRIWGRKWHGQHFFNIDHKFEIHNTLIYNVIFLSDKKSLINRKNMKYNCKAEQVSSNFNVHEKNTIFILTFCLSPDRCANWTISLPNWLNTRTKSVKDIHASITNKLFNTCRKSVSEPQLWLKTYTQNVVTDIPVPFQLFNSWTNWNF